MEPHGNQEKQTPPICEVIRLLGSKWAFAVISELGQGSKRFMQLQRNIAVVKTQSLTGTLRHLEAGGMVRREVFPTVPVTVEYSLTAKGMDFQSAVKEMENWASRWRNKEKT